MSAPSSSTGGDETQKTRFRIVLVNEAVAGGGSTDFYDLADLVDVDLVRKLRPEDDARGREVAPDRARRFHARELGIWISRMQTSGFSWSAIFTVSRRRPPRRRASATETPSQKSHADNGAGLCYLQQSVST